jgi:hypothetical protein
MAENMRAVVVAKHGGAAVLEVQTGRRLSLDRSGSAPHSGRSSLLRGLPE